MDRELNITSESAIHKIEICNTLGQMVSAAIYTNTPKTVRLNLRARARYVLYCVVYGGGLFFII